MMIRVKTGNQHSAALAGSLLLHLAIAAALFWDHGEGHRVQMEVPRVVTMQLASYRSVPPAPAPSETESIQPQKIPSPIQPETEVLRDVSDARPAAVPEPEPRLPEIVETVKHVQDPAVEAAAAEAPIAEAAAPEPPSHEAQAEEIQQRAQSVLAEIREMVMEHLNYPGMAKRMGWTGTVELKMTIDSEGTLLDASINRSSGRGILDKAALQAVAAISDLPLPRPMEETTVLLPVGFMLR